MKIDLVFPAFPPELDGIGDYTSRLAQELSERHEVRVLTAQPDAAPLEGTDVSVQRAFTLDHRSGVKDLIGPISARQPDWLLLQYNPFSYGRWGLNPYLPLVLRQMKEACPKMRVALTVHEPFVPVESLKFAVMTLWQRLQFWWLGHLADVAFMAIEPWVERFDTWFPETRVSHLPVSSNMPRVETDKGEIRKSLNFPPETLVVGLFGRGHSSRLLSFIRRAVDRLRRSGRDARVLYVGPAIQKVKRALDGIPNVRTGALPAAEVSRHFAAMDLYLAPFRKGVSARRGSFLVGLQHGVATVSTYGQQTDSLFYEHQGSAFLLAPDDDLKRFQEHALTLAKNDARREQIAQNGKELFESSFSWPRIVETMMDTLRSSSSSLTARVSSPVTSSRTP